MNAYIVICLISIMTNNIAAQITTVTCTPTLAPDMAARVTSNTVILQQPSCCFNDLQSLPCSSSTCQIWLVAALDSATGTFDADRSNPSFLSLSPYPQAFNSGSKNYFLTSDGVQSGLSCPSPANNYFKVGDDGQCSTTNCNGVLPVGKATRFKYLLVDPASSKLLAETQWSSNITLYASKPPESIGNNFGGRSAAMIVITAILCSAAGLLLLFLLIGCLIVVCCREKGKEEIRSIRESFRIPRYDMHNLKDSSPYDNPTFERDRKYTAAATLPKTAETTVVDVSKTPDHIKMQNI